MFILVVNGCCFLAFCYLPLVSKKKILLFLTVCNTLCDLCLSCGSMKNWQFDVHVARWPGFTHQKKTQRATWKFGSHKLHTTYRMVNGCVCIESKFLLWKTLRTSFSMAIDVCCQQVVEAQRHAGRFACLVGWISVPDTVDGCNQSGMPFSGSMTSLFLVGQTTRRWCSW